MRDFELYQAVLARVAGPVNGDQGGAGCTGQQVTVTVEAGPGPYPCPECQELVPGYDRKRRRWRHLDTCQFTTWIQAAENSPEDPSPVERETRHEVEDRQQKVDREEPAAQRREMLEVISGEMRHEPVSHGK